MSTMIGKILSIMHDLRSQFADRASVIWDSTAIKIYASFTLPLNIISWLAARRIDIEIDEPQIALHYTVDFGVDYYDDLKKIYIIPSLGLLLFVINIVLSALLLEHRDRSLLIHILLSSALLANIVLLGAVAIIYLINLR